MEDQIALQLEIFITICDGIMPLRVKIVGLLESFEEFRVVDSKSGEG